MFLILFFSIVSSAEAAKMLTGNPAQWRKCEKAEDCVLIESACGEISYGVNKKFKEKAKKYNEKMSQSVHCLEPSGDKFKVTCNENSCTAEKVNL